MPSIVSNSELLVALLKTSSIDAEHQAAITLYHHLVEDSIKSNLGYDPTYSSHTELYPVQSVRRQKSCRLQLRHIPVRSVSSVIVDLSAYGGQAPNAFSGASAETLSQGVDYFFANEVQGIGGTNGLAVDDGLCRTGILQFVDGNWPTIPLSVKVTYVSGYTSNELRGQGNYHTAGLIKLAVMDTLVTNFKQVVTQANAIESERAGTVTSERFGDYSYTIDSLSAALTNFSVTIPPSAYANLQPMKNFGILGV